MTAEILLFQFLRVSYEDGRIGPGHICLYFVLVQCWTENHFENPFPIVRDQVMQGAKIRGRRTYLKYLQELYRYGYIGYQPSHNHFQRSLISVENFSKPSR